MSNDHADLSLIQAQIALGFDMEDFKKSAVGLFFASRALEDMTEGLKKLRRADPFNGPEVARIQMKVNTAEQFFLWMEEAIETGNSAKQAFDEHVSEPADPV